MNRQTYVEKLINTKELSCEKAWAFAPSNIALCKYWGKKNDIFNLPTTPSVSISLGSRGSYVTITPSSQDSLTINEQKINVSNSSFKKTFDFLDLFRLGHTRLAVESWSNIPIAAGLASSASYFAALTLALNKLYGWKAPLSALSNLARLGSGSACRSLFHGFVNWDNTDDPFQSFGAPLPIKWPDLCVGLVLVHTEPKSISSRDAMALTQKTSPFYDAWCHQSLQDFQTLQTAIFEKNFERLGETAESNALSLHAVIMAARPSIFYSRPSTLEALHKVYELRHKGIQVYITQDAGPNVKLLFLEKDLPVIEQTFPTLDVIRPFVDIPNDSLAPFVVVVDENGQYQSFEEKQKAHREKRFHRALSVMLYRKKENGVEVLLQKRHPLKYHSGGLWGNTCCSHPQLFETLQEAAIRCLKEEVGITVPLKEIGQFSYRADFKNGLSEVEFDHVFVGNWDGDIPSFNPTEIIEMRWMSCEQLEKDIQQNPKDYVAWLGGVLENVKKNLSSLDL